MSAEAVLEALIARGLMLATAESCTGGMISAAITDVAGSSAAFDRGYVTYTNAAKTQMLGVAQATLAAHGAVSEEVAREKTSEQIAETREKKKEVRALRGMAGSTKGEVKKYKAQEKALDKKLATLAKSKRQQDARVARAKGRQAKAKKRAAQVEKVRSPRPFAPS